MEISDTEILTYTEIEADMKLMDKTYVNLRVGDRLVASIPVVSRGAAMDLIQQIEDYRKELENEAKEVPARDS